MDEKIPVHVITGFLGSGKTTLLKNILTHEAFGDSAVLVNEFGEVGLDDQLLGDIAQEAVLLSSGCVCCSIRGELSTALRELYSKRDRGEVPPFRRVVLETTGLADPGPIVSTLANDPVLQHHYRAGTTLTVVDAVNARVNQQSEPVWADQVASADAYVVSKADLVSHDEFEWVGQLVGRLNPTARRFHPEPGLANVDALFSGSRELTGLTSDWRISTGREVYTGVELNPSGHHPGLANVHTFTITLPGRLDWTCFGVWLSLLLHRHGRKLLRIKGILRVNESIQPLVIHGVQHTLFPPRHLEEIVPEDRCSQLVFITRGIYREEVIHSLETFLSTLGNKTSTI